MKLILVATGNAHKSAEIQQMLGSEWKVENLKDHPSLISPEEDGDTFSANAIIKALAASEALAEYLVLSDDSGLEVDALDGAPGVISARYAGVDATDEMNREKLKSALLQLSEDKKPFTGRFRCVMVVAKDGKILGEFDGAVEGEILTKEQGEGGFGYDPLFVPNGYTDTFGVLSSDTKNALSHRGSALRQFVTWANSQNF